MGNNTSSNTEPVINDIIVNSQEYTTKSEPIMVNKVIQPKILLEWVIKKNILQPNRYVCCDCGKHQAREIYYYEPEDEYYAFCENCWSYLWPMYFREYEDSLRNDSCDFDGDFDPYVSMSKIDSLTEWWNRFKSNPTLSFVDDYHPVENCLCPDCYNRGRIVYSTKVYNMDIPLCEQCWEGYDLTERYMSECTSYEAVCNDRNKLRSIINNNI